MAMLADSPVRAAPGEPTFSARAVSRTYTPEDLLHLPGGEHFELVNGMLQEKRMGLATSEVTDRVSRRLGNFVEEQNLGRTPAGECGYQCFPDNPNQVRKPDHSFTSWDRLPEAEGHEGHVRVAPDLAVEVSSPHDPVRELETQVAEYLAAGVRLVWVIPPHAQRDGLSEQRYGGTDRSGR